MGRLHGVSGVKWRPNFPPSLMTHVACENVFSTNVLRSIMAAYGVAQLFSLVNECVGYKDVACSSFPFNESPLIWVGYFGHIKRVLRVVVNRV